jgi:carbon storage regulator CsrA
MLVLSRRENEKIVFPTLGITVQVCGINRTTTRIGIDAPPSVPILREEVSSGKHAMPAPAGPVAGRHQLKNRLHAASLAVHLAQKQLNAGLADEADQTLTAALREFAALDQEMLAEKSPPPPAKRAIRALVVDDNSNECALLAEFLRLHGIKVETANDGQEALDYLKSHDRPDVVLLDMRMPRCDGPTTVAAIRRDAAYEGLKVFAVSGSKPDEWTVEPGARGVDGWFSKPINPVTLVRQMNIALGLN